MLRLFQTVSDESGLSLSSEFKWSSSELAAHNLVKHENSEWQHITQRHPPPPRPCTVQHVQIKWKGRYHAAMRPDYPGYHPNPDKSLMVPRLTPNGRRITDNPYSHLHTCLCLFNMSTGASKTITRWSVVVISPDNGSSRRAVD